MRGFAQILAAIAVSLSQYSNSQEINLHSDEFSVLRHVGVSYLSEYYPTMPNNPPDFGLGYTSYGELPFPKVGFIGFDVSGPDQEDTVLKLQLYKDETGWKVARVLDSSKIHQAHPTHSYESGHARTDASSRATVVASKSLEKELNKNSIMQNVRGTSMSCYVTKDRTAASCRGVYRVVEDSEVVCRVQSYLMNSEEGEWKTIRSIADNQKVDYVTGKLIIYKPFPPHCG